MAELTYENIHDFYHKHKGQDNVEVLQSMSRLDLIGFLATFYQLKNQVKALEDEYEALLIENEEQKSIMASDIEQKYQQSKQVIYDDYVEQKQKGSFLQSHLNQNGLLKSYLWIALISTVITTIVGSIFINFIVAMLGGRPILMKEAFFLVVTSLIYSFVINLILVMTPLKSKQDWRTKHQTTLLRGSSIVLAAVLAFLPMVVITIIGGEASDMIKSFTQILFMFVIVPLFILSWLCHYILSRIVPKHNEGVTQRYYKEAAKRYPDNQLREQLTVNQSLAQLDQDFYQTQQDIETNPKFSENLPQLQEKLDLLSNFIPIKFQSDELLAELVAHLSEGYAENWKEAIKEARNESHHREISSYLASLHDTLNRFYQDSVRYYQNSMRNQQQINQTLQGAQVLLSEVNQQAAETTDAINHLRNKMDNNHRQQQALIQNIDQEVMLLTSNRKVRI